jgi:hypothetical protein
MSSATTMSCREPSATAATSWKPCLRRHTAAAAAAARDGGGGAAAAAPRQRAAAMERHACLRCGIASSTAVQCCAPRRASSRQPHPPGRQVRHGACDERRGAAGRVRRLRELHHQQRQRHAQRVCEPLHLQQEAARATPYDVTSASTAAAAQPAANAGHCSRHACCVLPPAAWTHLVESEAYAHADHG